jgi:hypothetical protein
VRHATAVEDTLATVTVPWPPAEIVHRIHDRFLVEVVEELGLCPFARRSRELGRVHRPIWWVEHEQPTPDACARALADLCTTHDDAEIVLLAFVVPDGHPWCDAEAFASFASTVRQAHDASKTERFFMVPFHPGFEPPPPGPRPRLPTPEALVPMLRRTPDPVIQCVRAAVLERVRAQAQVTARERLRERFAHDPVMSAMIEKSVQADPELSADIARHNFAAVGAGPGRDALEHVIADITRDRAASYARPDEPAH